MKIIIVGASGKIGREIDKAVSSNHEVVRVGATSGDVQCDYTSADSVTGMIEAVGPFDALVAVAGGDNYDLHRSSRFVRCLANKGEDR